MPRSKRHGKDYLRKREYLGHRRRQLSLFIEMLNKLGACCKCCGEKEPDFLTLDHINGGGAKERKENSQTYGVYSLAKSLNWPKDIYQVLCMNCNWAKRRTGSCSHKTLNMRKYILDRDGVFYLSENALKLHYLNGSNLRNVDLRLKRHGAGLVNGLLRISVLSPEKLVA